MTPATPSRLRTKARGARAGVDRVINSPSNYWFTLVTDPVAAIAFLLLGRSFGGSASNAGVCVVVGFLSWGAIEYGVHRWVLHGPASLAKRAHARHHANGGALISAPAFMSAALAAGAWAVLLVVLPAGLAAYGVFGLYAGYNYYALLHHLEHRHRALLARVPYFASLDRAHRIHHTHAATNWGVSTTWWDRLLGSHRPSDASDRSLERSSGSR